MNGESPSFFTRKNPLTSLLFERLTVYETNCPYQYHSSDYQGILVIETTSQLITYSSLIQTKSIAAFSLLGDYFPRSLIEPGTLQGSKNGLRPLTPSTDPQLHRPNCRSHRPQQPPLANLSNNTITYTLWHVRPSSSHFFFFLFSLVVIFLLAIFAFKKTWTDVHHTMCTTHRLHLISTLKTFLSTATNMILLPGFCWNLAIFIWA